MIVPTSISEQLLFSTVRIETRLETGLVGTGTGFFFDFIYGEKRFPTIITNKHVIEGAKQGSFQVHESATVDGKKRPSGNFFTIAINNFDGQWILHPDPKVDLCAMPFNPLRIEAEKIGKEIFNPSLDGSLIQTDTSLEQLSAVEEVLMFGYPIGLWDDKNNLPLIRRGITSTHPAIDYRGESIMVIDASCFPGSSGSPVLVVNEGAFTTKQGINLGSSRLIFLGVLSHGPFMEAKGEIIVKDIPTVKHPTAITEIMINLGYVVKAKEILKLGEYIEKKFPFKTAEVKAG